MKVLIYSNRRNAWWRKDFAGYGLIEDAGIYELDDVLSQRCYSGFDFDKKKSDYFVKLEDAMDEFAKRKSELLDQQKVLEEKIASQQKVLEEKIASIVFAINQIEKGGTGMERKEGVFLSETKLSRQQICDILVLLRLTLKNADESIVGDNEITLRYGDNVINIPKKSSIYKMIKEELR